VNDHAPSSSDFATADQAAAHLRWVEAKVAASLADTREPVEHDVAMQRSRAILEAKAPRA
jgi:hypothetical protein